MLELRRRALLLPVLVLAGLTACTTPAPDSDETYVSDTEDATNTPAATVTPNPIEPDTTLIVRSTATAENGAQLQIEVQVHQSIRWDDVANQTLPAALLEDCASLFTGAKFADEQWSFTRVNLTAIPVAGSADWPADATITALPSTEFVPVAGRGDFLSAGDAATPLCQRDKYLAASGKAGLAFGIPGDGPALTAWASHLLGVTVDGATLTGCTVEVTDLGRQRGAESGSWTVLADDVTCAAGGVDEPSVF